MRNNDEIITIIKSAMKEQDMSLSELARRVGVAKSAVSRYLNLTREFPLNRTEDFAKALSISTEYLLGFDKSEQQDEQPKHRAAHLEGKLTDEEWQRVLDYADYIRSKTQIKGVFMGLYEKMLIKHDYIEVRETNVMPNDLHGLWLAI